MTTKVDKGMKCVTTKPGHQTGGDCTLTCLNKNTIRILWVGISKYSAIQTCHASQLWPAVTLASDQAQLTWQHICQAEVALVFDALQT